MFKTTIKFKNNFETEEIHGLIKALLSMVARDPSTAKIYSAEVLKPMLQDSRRQTIEIGLKNTRFERLLQDFETIGLPYLIVFYKKNSQTGIVYDGVNRTELKYDNKRNLLGRMDGIIEAIELLENNKEMKALVVLNQFCIRTDVENMPRMTFSTH
jgi:hypothetical protein